MENNSLGEDVLDRAIEEVKPPETREYIENNLARFFHILRHLGLRISSAETVDAVKAVAALDILDRSQVRTALLATLAKTPEDRVILDRSFGAFFVTPERKAERSARYEEVKVREAKEMDDIGQDLKYEMETHDGQETKEVALPLNEEEKRIYSKLPPENRQKLQSYLSKQFQSNPVNNPEHLITNLVRSYLNYWKYYLKMNENRPPDVNLTGDMEVDEVLQEVIDQLHSEENILYQDIRKITETDMPTAAALISKLSRQLATRIARRYRRSKKKQRLDLRRTIRQNIRYGGTMFNLKYKTRRMDKPRILLICDVSGSMAKYAGFVLQFMYGLATVTEQIECFIFSEGVERVTGQFNKFCNFEETMAQIINKSDSWGRGTDFNHALAVILEQHRDLVTKNTFVIIVSDTKTLNADQAIRRMQVFRKAVKDVIWLNTLPKKVWSNTYSVSMFARHSRMFECNTLSHLDKIMRNQLLK